MKKILKIKEISYGEFPEISELNPRFKLGSQKVKVVLDIMLPEKGRSMDIFLFYSKLMKLLPTLEKHQCGEHLLEDLKSGKKTHHSETGAGACLSQTDKITDIAHLMEHVIIDVQSKVTGMDSCSGITCGYKIPDYRFDMFVESKDKKVGVFSVFFAAELFKQLVRNKNISRRYSNLIEMARYVHRNQLTVGQAGLDFLVGRIKKELGLKESTVLSLLKKLKELGFFNGKPALMSQPTLR